MMAVSSAADLALSSWVMALLMICQFASDLDTALASVSPTDMASMVMAL